MIDDEISGGTPFAFTYDDAEWSAVAAALSRLTVGAAEIDQERKHLEFVATAYLNLAHHHRRRNADASPTKTWKQTRGRIIADLASAEKAGAIASVLSDLREETRCADVAVEGYGVLGHVHQGRKNPARDWLYDAALAMWKRLGGQPMVSHRRYGTAPASGPMIDFMTAALVPVMRDDAPGVEAIAKFVKNKQRKAKVGA